MSEKNNPPTRYEMDLLTKNIDSFVSGVKAEKKIMEDRLAEKEKDQHEVNKDFHTRLTVIETTFTVWMRVIGVLTAILILVNLIMPFIRE